MSMTQDRSNLILAGFMGTGKSTIGPIAARTLRRAFVDTDQLIEQQVGQHVSEIFARHGERTFRALEREVCRRVAGSVAQVVAIGGGALLDPGNRTALEATGVVVLLTCRPDVLVERLRESARRGERPLLAGDVEAMIARLLKEREPVYSSIRLKVDTTGIELNEIAEKVVALYTATLRHTTEVEIV